MCTKLCQSRLRSRGRWRAGGRGRQWRRRAPFARVERRRRRVVLLERLRRRRARRRPDPRGGRGRLVQSRAEARHRQVGEALGEWVAAAGRESGSGRARLLVPLVPGQKPLSCARHAQANAVRLMIQCRGLQGLLEGFRRARYLLGPRPSARGPAARTFPQASAPVSLRGARSCPCTWAVV